ncbi:hypothetical protein [Mameliella alba]|uniref:hypothetical protein n=1 Tax=Mameliella alba TaxID=561184 RepID=UPI000B52BF29|nr:hypothetical protein [Mameliella alba]MBY6118053.1 hypothetical protein [Mameliella alba]OWV42213.1 hypothetical protein CDZ95_14320 [Mameliella alba]OWV63944.1 hypothetical protein CDZ97_13105 [Mameliella alba]
MRGTAALAVLCLMAAPGTVLAQSYAAEFAQAVERCWVIDVNSEAADIGVTLAFSVLPDGRIQPDSVHLIRASSGSKAAIDRAFQPDAVRFCGASGAGATTCPPRITRAGRMSR